jgi:hypothetical protein
MFGIQAEEVILSFSERYEDSSLLRHDAVSICKHFGKARLLVTYDEGRELLQTVDEYLPTDMSNARRIPSSGLKTLQNKLKQLTLSVPS